jgi:hypothetical protein
MKRILLILPMMMLVACGQFAHQQAPVNEVIGELNQDGYISEADQEVVEAIESNDEVLEDVTVTEDIANGDNMMVLDLRGQKAVVEYMNDSEYAFKINGLPVPHAVAQDSKALDGLLEGLIDVGLDQLINGLIGGLPADVTNLIQLGLQIINGGNIGESLGQIAGVVVRGFFNVFLETIPFGDLLAPIIGGIADEILGNDEPAAGTPESSLGEAIVGIISDLFK